MSDPKFGYIGDRPALTPPSTTEAALGYANPQPSLGYPDAAGWPTAPQPGGPTPGMGGMGSPDMEQLLATRDMIDKMLEGMGYTRPSAQDQRPYMDPNMLAQQTIARGYSPGAAAPGGTGKVHFTGGLSHPNPALTDPTGPRMALIANILTALGNLRRGNQSSTPTTPEG